MESLVNGYFSALNLDRDYDEYNSYKNIRYLGQVKLKGAKLHFGWEFAHVVVERADMLLDMVVAIRGYGARGWGGYEVMELISENTYTSTYIEWRQGKFVPVQYAKTTYPNKMLYEDYLKIMRAYDEGRIS